MTDKKNISQIIDLTTGQKIDLDSAVEFHDIVSQWLTVVPDRIKTILDTPTWENIVVSVEEASQLVLDYMIFHLKKRSIGIDPTITPGIQYLAELMSKFMFLEQDEELKIAIDNPYYIHWASLWEYKKAWDASVYKYLFWESWRKDSMKRDDYVGFAMNGYYQHFKNENFAKSVWKILPNISWISEQKDFFRRELTSIL